MPTKILAFRGIERTTLEEAEAGDRVAGDEAGVLGIECAIGLGAA